MTVPPVIPPAPIQVFAPSIGTGGGDFAPVPVAQPAPAFVQAIQQAVQQTPALQADQIVQQAAQPIVLTPSVVHTVETENRAIAQAATPQQKAQVLSDLVAAKTDTLTKTTLTSSAEVGATVFTASRLDQQLDTLINTARQDHPTTARARARHKKIQAQVQAACDDIGAAMRALQVIVPDGVEQDIEIPLGKCLNL